MNAILNILLSSTDTVFYISALSGITLFFLRMMISFWHGLLDVEHGDMHGAHGGDAHHHDMPSFKFFTLHSVSGFLMIFGVTGLACVHQYNMSYIYAFLIALLAGLAIMLVTALIFWSALFLEGSGQLFDINKTQGLQAQVYQRIPENGIGKIHIIVHGVTRELLAQSANKESIESFTDVTVVTVINHETVIVSQHGKDVS